MINQKVLMSLTKDQQLDIIKCKVLVARKALELCEGEDPEVTQMFKEYVKEAEDVLEKAIWAMSK